MRVESRGRQATRLQAEGPPGLQKRLPPGHRPGRGAQRSRNRLLPGVAGAGDDQVEAGQGALDQSGLGHARQAVLQARVGRQALEDGQRRRALERQVDAHVGAAGRVLQVAPGSPGGAPCRPGRARSSSTSPSFTALSQAQSLSALEALTTTR